MQQPMLLATPEMTCEKIFLGIIGVFEIIIFVVLFFIYSIMKSWVSEYCDDPEYYDVSAHDCKVVNSLLGVLLIISLFFLLCGVLNEMSACCVANVKTHIQVRIAYIVMQAPLIILNIDRAARTGDPFYSILLVVNFIGVAISIYVIRKCKRH